MSLTLAPGRIHAVLGENGAGKSTLMGVLAGFVLPDAGTVTLDGRPVPLGNPAECRRAGIAMVHQHFALVPAFTVEENLALAAIDRPFRPVRFEDAATRALNLAADLGWSFDPKARTGQLPVGVQQRLEIVKALATDAPVLIFDEPTAVLSPTEVEDLFRVLRNLRDQGKVIALIAHKLSEVLSVADEVTVLRRGRFVAESPIASVDAVTLAQWMVGDLPAPQLPLPPSDSPEGLSVESVVARGARGETAVRGVSFQVRRGEILGVGGVDGNGQIELAEVLAGVIAPVSGRVAWGNLDAPEPPQRLDYGEVSVAYIPQDRQRDGLALRFSIRDNHLVTGHRRVELSKRGLLLMGAVRLWSRSLIDRFQVKANSTEDLVGGLSGGNQQKVVVSRSLDKVPDLIVAVNPTRGLDIQATDYVHEQILSAARKGAAVVLISTDLDELAALSSRRVYLSRGALAEGDGAVALVGGQP
ncbi:MAG: ATP-binding cassette domain-containing protein [Fimbriimonadaceae bacterium]